MSPRCTEALHEFGYCEHFGAIVLVGFEGCNLGCESFSVLEPGRGVEHRAADGVGPRDAVCLELAERS